MQGNSKPSHHTHPRTAGGALHCTHRDTHAHISLTSVPPRQRGSIGRQLCLPGLETRGESARLYATGFCGHGCYSRGFMYHVSPCIPCMYTNSRAHAYTRVPGDMARSLLTSSTTLRSSPTNCPNPPKRQIMCISIMHVGYVGYFRRAQGTQGTSQGTLYPREGTLSREYIVPRIQDVPQGTLAVHTLP